MHAPGSDATNLRVLLVADLLVRALEIGGTPVWALLTGGSRQAELRADAAALGIRPFEDSPDVSAGLGEAQVVHVAAAGGTAPDGVRIAVAPVEAAGPGTSGGERREAGTADDVSAEPGPPADKSSEPSPPSGRPAEEDPRADKSSASDRSNGRPMGPGTLGGVDPTVLRLALLTRHHNAPVRLEEAVLEEAGATLARWRGAVARWARRPSRPVPDEVRGRLREAWEDDLDVPRVLDELRRVENEPELPEGARFETYAYADRLLGLELTRDLGAPS
ncbi:Cysteinyl-tRNA synthetase OS=Streptomyces violarus OX=67380 GN=FHS41_007994 PE=4 SV=1 [Streptomyces violarus]